MPYGPRLTSFEKSLSKQLFQRAVLVEILQVGVGRAEAGSLRAGQLQQRDVHVGRGAVAFVAVAGVIDVAARLQLAAHVADHQHRPFPASAVVGFGAVAEVEDDRVVQHRAIALGHGLQLADQARDQVHVVAADDVVQLVPLLAFEAAAVADRMLVEVDTQALERHVALSTDIVAKNPENNYDRKVFLRYPPDGESTPATRATGLLAMRSFLQDSRFSRYPPATIEMLDVTNFDSEKPAAMDEYIMNCDIQSLVVHDVQDTDLKSNFKAEFPECANCMWKSENVGDFGQSLGF